MNMPQESRNGNDFKIDQIDERDPLFCQVFDPKNDNFIIIKNRFPFQVIRNLKKKEEEKKKKKKQQCSILINYQQSFR